MPLLQSRIDLRAGFGTSPPDHPPYDEARALFNAMVDKRPAASRSASPPPTSPPRCGSRAGGCPRRRGGGHSVTGRSLVDDGIVIDLRPMKDIVIDAERRVATVGGGCTWAEFDRAAQALASPPPAAASPPPASAG